MNNNQLKDRLEALNDPYLKKSLQETKGLKYLGYDPDQDVVTVIVNIAKVTPEYTKIIKREIATVIKNEFKHKGVKIQINEDLTQNLSKDDITKTKVNFIGIISGKGGVGKSSIACNIAYYLAKKGLKVGLIDADIYGSSIPSLLGINHQHPNYNQDKKIVPLQKHGIEVISAEFFTNPHQPIIWRGKMINQLLTHFFHDVAWDQDTQFIIIDLPPGTGDVCLDINQLVPQAEMVLVTTPHQGSARVAIKAGLAAQKMGHNLIGVIENMAYYINPVNQNSEYIFGTGGAQLASQELGVEVIENLAIEQPQNDLCLFEPNETNGQKFSLIADYLWLHFLLED